MKEEIIEDQVAWKVFGTKVTRNESGFPASWEGIAMLTMNAVGLLQIELTLPKRNGGRNWSSLTGDGTTTGTAVNMQSVAGPSRSVTFCLSSTSNIDRLPVRPSLEDQALTRSSSSIDVSQQSSRFLIVRAFASGRQEEGEEEVGRGR